MWWECAATEECRKDVKKVSQEDLDALPEVTKSCGIILDDPELDEWFSKLAEGGQDEEEMWPPRTTVMGSSKSQEMVRAQADKEI